MTRLFATLLILIILLLLGFSFGAPHIKNYFGGGKDNISIIELGKTLTDIKKINKDRKNTIKENEKIAEDLDEKN